MVAAAVLFFSIEIVAPRLLPYAGPPSLREHRSFTVPATPKVYLENVDGSIQIETLDPSEGDEVRVEADIRIYKIADEWPDFELAEFVDGIIELESNSDIVRIRSVSDDWPGSLGVRVDYRLYIPKNTDVEIAGTNGNIHVAEGCGEVIVHSGNADIEILKPGGMVIASSTNGRIRVLDALRSTTLETVNGNILARMQEGMLHASTVNGSIESFLPGSGVSGVTLTSDNGSIQVVLPEESGFMVEAVAPLGGIHSDFVLEQTSSLPGSNRLSGTVGSGEIRLNLNSRGGSIRITKG